MGLEHSQPRPPRPRSSSSSPVSPLDPQSVVIERSDIPEAYLHVAVSDDVISRVKSQQHGEGGEESQEKWREELAKEREANDKLREKMHELKQLQTRHQNRADRTSAMAAQNSYSSSPQEATSPERMKELKKVFSDKIEEVQKRFFNYRRENACADNEKIIACLAKNQDKVLNCRHLMPLYNQCISDFRSSVLSEKSQPSVVTT